MAHGDWQGKLQGWMRGRQGPDDLALFCSNAAIVLLVVNLFARVAWLYWVGFALLAYAVFRICSKNMLKRGQENAAFLKALGPARPWIQNPKAALSEARAYKHVKCSGCGQKVRVPRGKGKLRVTCPKCRTKFEVKS